MFSWKSFHFSVNFFKDVILISCELIQMNMTELFVGDCRLLCCFWHWLNMLQSQISCPSWILGLFIVCFCSYNVCCTIFSNNLMKVRLCRTFTICRDTSIDTDWEGSEGQKIKWQVWGDDLVWYGDCAVYWNVKQVIDLKKKLRKFSLWFTF